ncbi:MAG: glycosyltransferase family 4 protein [Acidaminobacteraceae bacterium]
MNQKIVILISDQLTNIVSKGEVTNRYYNPNNIFDEVHIIMSNNDIVSEENFKKVQLMSGNAKLYLYNVPFGIKEVITTCGFRPILMKRWSKKIHSIIDSINPSIIRSHGNFVNSFAGASYRANSDIKFIMSLHTIYDASVDKRIKRKILIKLLKRSQTYALEKADCIVSVYSSIQKTIDTKFEGKSIIIYNSVNPNINSRKEDYSIGDTINIVSFGRQIVGKDPTEILKAIKNIKNSKLTLIGDGSLHGKIVELVNELKITDRVEIIKSMDNTRLIELIKKQDMVLIPCDYDGIPKTVIESLLIGMPTIVTKIDIGEYDGDHILQVYNEELKYTEMILELANSLPMRKNIGDRAYRLANDNWSPRGMEKKYSDLYIKYMKKV